MSEGANYTIYIFRSSAKYVSRDFHLSIVDGILLYRPLCIRQVCFYFLSSGFSFVFFSSVLISEGLPQFICIRPTGASCSLATAARIDFFPTAPELHRKATARFQPLRCTWCVSCWAGFTVGKPSPSLGIFFLKRFESIQWIFFSMGNGHVFLHITFL